MSYRYGMNTKVRKMSIRRMLLNERGSAWGWIFTIFIVIVVAIGVFLTLTRFAVIPAPSFLANQPWMASFLPPKEETPASEVPELPAEASLRNQLVALKTERDTAQGRITALEADIAAKDKLVKEREDEIARLRSTLDLASKQNVNKVALMYENMEPQDAAKILANLGAYSASLILGAMRESKSADVLALMDEALATEITQIMAGFKQSGSAPSQTGPPSGAGTVQPPPGGSTTPPATTTPPASESN